MKKKNWLLTLALGVLSLTIISTCVIGSTYAKYTSTITSSASIQAAGFLVTGGNATVSGGNVMLAPGLSDNAAIGNISYFSQVATTVTVEAVVDDAQSTGVFTATNWAALVTYYNTHVATTGHEVDSDLAVSDLITITNSAANSIADAIFTAGGSTAFGDGTHTAGTNTLPAMVAGANSAVTASGVSVTFAWTTSADVTNDEFDTFVGNVIYLLANNTTITSANEGVGTATLTPVAGQNLVLTGVAANQTSSVGVGVSITVAQVTA